MPTLYNQAIAHRFGVELRESIDSGEWKKFDFAVAWVRRTGIRHLEPSLRSFLRSGGVLRGIVGVDLENTSHEGLQDLLGICADGDGQVFVYHNESIVTFHPKVYLFSNDTRASLIVGSNNLTEAGLYLNTEVGLQVEAPIADPVIVDAKTALLSWSDVHSLLARRLDAALLADLVAEGYVLPEKKIRERLEETRKSSKPAGRARRRLFGTRTVTAPPPPGGRPPAGGPTGGGGAGGGTSGGTGVRRRRVPGGGSSNTVGNVLLMRVRRASEKERRTQIQLPVRKLQSFFGSNFFDGATSVTSSHDGRVHEIREASARGSRNTTKLEVPEIEDMADPLMRFERTENGIIYEAYDRNTAQGRQIMRSLNEGRQTTPATTMLTVADEASASMARHV